jgi:hypothetical protein
MDKPEFGKFVKSLCLYFERKQPDPEVRDAWFEALQYLPGEALDWIAARLQESEVWPRNFPGLVKDLFRRWREAHPEKRAPDEKPGCQECDGGYLRVSQEAKNGQWCNLAFRCGNCNLHGPPRIMRAARRWDLLQEGIYHRPTPCLATSASMVFPARPVEEKKEPESLGGVGNMREALSGVPF